jgi:hypothetical protein
MLLKIGSLRLKLYYHMFYIQAGVPKGLQPVHLFNTMDPISLTI